MNIVIDKTAEPVTSGQVVILEVAPPPTQITEATIPVPEPEEEPQVS